MKNNKRQKLGIIGLGYVGLPLAIEFSKKREVIGFDINKDKIRYLKKQNKLKFKIYDDLSLLKDCAIIIVAVPTPINKNKNPDLNYLKRACTDIGKTIQKDTIIIFESTVYPGCTEEFCIPIIQKISKLEKNKNLFYGYSPERINPGDKFHTISKINKLVSGSNNKTTLKIKKLYQEIVKSKVHITKTIKIPIPASWAPGQTLFDVGIAQSGYPLGTPTQEVSVEIMKRDLPKISLKFGLQEHQGKLDGVLESQEKAKLKVTMSNESNVKAKNLKVRLVNLTGEQLKLNKKKTGVNVLDHKDSKAVFFDIQGGKEIIDQKMTLGILIESDDFESPYKRQFNFSAEPSLDLH